MCVQSLNRRPANNNDIGSQRTMFATFMNAQPQNTTLSQSTASAANLAATAFIQTAPRRYANTIQQQPLVCVLVYCHTYRFYGAANVSIMDLHIVCNC